MFAFLFRSLPLFHSARVLLRLLSPRGLQLQHPELRKLVICGPSGLLCYWCISQGVDLSEESLIKFIGTSLGLAPPSVRVMILADVRLYREGLAHHRFARHSQCYQRLHFRFQQHWFADGESAGTDDHRQ